MPRRRMIGPEFWDDEYIGGLSDTERIFIIGCIGNADDEGRLKGRGAYLKSSIFMYDVQKSDEFCSELKTSLIESMSVWPVNHPYKLISYENGHAEYLFFPNWAQSNKPSHPTPSKLPAPPDELLPIFSGEPLEELPNPSGDTPSQVRGGEGRLGQSSLGKVSIGQVREVQEDFTNFLNNEKGLTDCLTTTLTEYVPRGPAHSIAVIQKLWSQATGHKMDDNVFGIVFSALAKYPVPVLAKSIVKAVNYSPGKRKPANYIKTILDDQMSEYEKERPP